MACDSWERGRGGGSSIKDLKNKGTGMRDGNDSSETSHIVLPISVKSWSL